MTVIKEHPAAMGPGRRPAHRNDFLYYGLRNKKLVFGLALEILLILFAIVGPVISPHNTIDFFKLGARPSGQNWLGTDSFGHDVFAQLAAGLRQSYLVGALGAACAAAVGMALGFIAGWRGGLLDEALQLLTNVIVMIPSLVLLVVIGSYMSTRSVLFEGVFIGLTTWPWVARAVRAQTFSLRSRGVRRAGQAVGQARHRDHRQGHRAEHGVLPVPGGHLAVRQLDAARGELRLPRARPEQHGLARLDDAEREPQQRAVLPHVVVDLAAGHRPHRDGRRAAGRQRRP
jgi:hypothetical protein